MIKPKYLREHFLEAEWGRDTVYRVGAVTAREIVERDLILTCPLVKQRQLGPDDQAYEDIETVGEVFVRVRCYGDDVLRLGIGRKKDLFDDDSPMLEWTPELLQGVRPLQQSVEGRFSASGHLRFSEGSGPYFSPTLQLASQTIAFQDTDFCFLPFPDAMPLVFIEREEQTISSAFVLKIAPTDHFCGLGERFDRVDLFGRQVDLVNEDTRGVSTSRGYKNIPFLLSSRPYGVFVHSSAKMRVDVGCHSTQSLQWMTDDDYLDIFFIGGQDMPEVLLNYRRITGFPRKPPVWSFGAWMSKMSYMSAEEVQGVGERLREEAFPMDVIHIDPGWFAENWGCDWTFSPDRFPDPPAFFAAMRDMGFRISLWQWPYIIHTTKLSKTAIEKGYVGVSEDMSTRIVMPALPPADTLDLTNPEAVAWYQDLLRDPLEKGASVIKADFGERINEKATYAGMPAAKYRNLYALLYQRAVWEVTKETKGDGIIWARAGWAGCQRYPVHWGGDCASTYEGLASTICGGLHLGASGFAFWGHDVGGFFGIPDFMTCKPSEDLYLRWVQTGAFSSHMRFHGTSPREPWNYPGIAPLVRQWLRLRYALIPYLLQQADKCVQTGLPMLRALVLEWPEDPAVWSISTQFLLGDAFLVCPVLSPEEQRNVYLPAGEWVDFWTGEVFSGPVLLRDVAAPLPRMPIYVRHGASIEFAEPVQCTDDLENAQRFEIIFDDSYKGLAASELGEHIQL